MSTAARKKQKAENIRSTDRGGAVLLPLGVALVAFGMMLLMGAVLDTTAMALNLFKRMAIGLGGGLYFVFPFILMWLGALLVVSSKRYVSFYPFIISLLLFMALGAFLTLSLKVDDRSYPRLMPYLSNLNSLRGAPYPNSLGEYLYSIYNLPLKLPATYGMYHGGGALSMLLAYPLYMTLGNFGALTVIVLLFIGLVFALIRVGPARLVSQISERLAGREHRVERTARPVTQTAQNPAQAYPEEPHTQYAQPQYEPVMEEQTARWPAPAQQSAQANWFEPQPAQPQQASVEPGFIRQEQENFFDDYQQPAYQPAARTQPAQPAKPANEPQKRWQPFHPAQPEPAHTIVEHTETRPQPETANGSRRRANRQEKPAEEAARLPWEEQELVEQAAQPAPESRPRADSQPRYVEEPPAAQPVEEKPAEAAPAVRRPAAFVKEAPPKPVHTEPAVELTGKRIPVKPAAALETGLDNMAKKTEPSQIKLVFDDYTTPPLRLLTEGPRDEQGDTTEEDRVRAEKLIETLKSFAITAHLHDIVHGPTVTRFAIRLAEGVNVSKLRNVMDNLTIELKAKGDIRAEMPIPGTSFVGLEVSNDKTSKVFLRDVLESPRMTENRSPTAVALGKDITGTPIVCELMDMPHLLIAGATGSGKSVCINSIICSMLYRASPRNVRLIMVDPKFVELQPYNDVPHLMMPVITDAKKATAALEWVCQEMDRRYQVLVDAGVRNLDAYNKKLGPDEEPLPRIIVIVDEMADLMTTSGKMIEDHIKRITAKARAAGICLILATQRPSVNIITGVIKANIPGRIAFRVSSPFDSKTILDSQGAEKLLGYGDMLYRSQTRDPIRVQGCFVSDHDVEQTVGFIRSRNKAEYDLDLVEFVEQGDQAENGNGSGADSMDGGEAEFDELLPQAIEMAVEAGQMSISMLQRVLRVGYARSGRLIDEMARRGIISGNEGTKARKTLMTREQYLNYLEQGF